MTVLPYRIVEMEQDGVTRFYPNRLKGTSWYGWSQFLKPDFSCGTKAEAEDFILQQIQDKITMANSDTPHAAKLRAIHSAVLEKAKSHIPLFTMQNIK